MAAAPAVCPCGARFEPDTAEAAPACPGCDRPIGGDDAATSHVVVSVRGRSIPYRLWEAESLVSAASWIAVIQAGVCAAFLIAFLSRPPVESYPKSLRDDRMGDARLGLVCGVLGSLGGLLRVRSSIARWGLVLVEGSALALAAWSLRGGGEDLWLALASVALHALFVLYALLQPWAGRVFDSCYEGIALTPIWRGERESPASLLVSLSKGLIVLSVLGIVCFLGPLVLILMFAPLD